MTPPMPPELAPGLLISGSSPAGQAAAVAIGATAVEYPGPAGLQDRRGDPGPAPPARGIRIGIVAREDSTMPGALHTNAFQTTGAAALPTRWR